ncbi:cysteine dioxygenase family protein [Caballeronia sp. GAFFF1]|uniref:cysteine dioxygenase family protein n=1 Tax=Caballeronia sp. GAFFF1 TaxID=2921779 RepID=UPI002027CB03
MIDITGTHVIMELELATQRSVHFPADRNAAVGRLCHEIDTALDAAQADGGISFGVRVHAALSRAIADPALLRADQRAGSPQGYQRHLLAADPLGRYAIAALVWEPGQSSPVHAHRTWCGYAVIDGALAETQYRWDANSHRAIETRRHPREAGAVSYADAGRGAIHQLCNPADATTRAVSIHIYGVAGEHIATHVNDLLAA